MKKIIKFSTIGIIAIVWLFLVVDVNRRFPAADYYAATKGNAVEHDDIKYEPVSVAIYDAEQVKEKYPGYNIFEIEGRKLYYIAFEYDITNNSGQLRKTFPVLFKARDNKTRWVNGLAPADAGQVGYYLFPGKTVRCASIASSVVEPSGSFSILIYQYPDCVYMDFSGCEVKD